MKYKKIVLFIFIYSITLFYLDNCKLIEKSKKKDLIYFTRCFEITYVKDKINKIIIYEELNDLKEQKNIIGEYDSVFRIIYKIREKNKNYYYDPLTNIKYISGKDFITLEKKHELPENIEKVKEQNYSKIKEDDFLIWYQKKKEGEKTIVKIDKESKKLVEAMIITRKGEAEKIIKIEIINNKKRINKELLLYERIISKSKESNNVAERYNKNFMENIKEIRKRKLLMEKMKNVFSLLKKYPEYYDGYIELGKYYYIFERNLNKAEIIFRNAIKIDKNKTEAYGFLVSVLLAERKLKDLDKLMLEIKKRFGEKDYQKLNRIKDFIMKQRRGDKKN